MQGLSWCVCLGGVSMPSKPPRPCMVQGCRGFSTGNGYCKEHQYIHLEKMAVRQKRVDDKRGQSQDRGYDWQWRKVRRLKFLSNPLCEWCESKGIIKSAEEIHHIVSIKEAPDKRLEIDNLQSLCKACHEKTK